jgi:hypothetical protein
MALVVRIDTWERIGYSPISRPLPLGASGCMFDAWRHPDGGLRHEPPSLPFEAGGPLERSSPVKLSIPVHNPASRYRADALADLSRFHRPPPDLSPIPAATLARNGLAASR